MTDPQPTSPPHENKSSVKETLISVVISFALAFVFRGFVVEAFLIPTGSMAPTLMGAHMRFTDPKNGYSWPVGPWEGIGSADEPPPFQGATPTPRGSTPKIKVKDPITLEDLGERTQVRTRAGDRIFVMKYLYSIYDPHRFDVVVFKNPNNPQENYIKRLIGLPNEEIALADGDVFVRSIPPDEKLDTNTNSWLLPGWSIARKPELAQRSMWQLVFDSRYTPIVPATERPYASPWIAQDPGWDIANKREYTYAGETPTTLSWDSRREIRDYYAYNEGPSGVKNAKFPVSDLRVSMGVKPKARGLSWSAVVVARGHEFRASIRPTSPTACVASVEMRPIPSGDASDTPWTSLAQKELPVILKPGQYVNLDFWHVDQSLQLWIDDTLAVRGEYNWSIDERLSNALTIADRWKSIAMNTFDGLANRQIYKSPQVRVEFSGGAFQLARVALSRDIFYQPDTAVFNQAKSARATSPRAPIFLNAHQFFVCGDNSPSSLDGRYWDMPDPWVAQLDETHGVVNRDLLIGKAFFVYFPSPEWVRGIPIPDVGRMRFIW
jgi:signal peptidase I